MAKYAKGFEGNPHIRGPSVPIQWTKKSLSEYGKCADDPLHFIRNYVYIKSVDSEDLILFATRPYQDEMVEKMVNNRFVIVKLPRQAGKTVIVSALLLWNLIFQRNYSILIAANKGSKANDVLKMVKDMYEKLPEFLQHGISIWNKGSIELETGSKIRATATSGSSARGDTVNLIYIDEAAFIPTHVATEFFESVVPTISSGKTSKIFITSTPKGLNHFYSMYKAAIEGKSGYAHVEIKWNDVPGRDEKFRAQIVAQFGQRYFDQEYGAEFHGSSSTLIDGAKLTTLVTEHPVSETPTYRIYANPEPHHSYAITVDVAEGLGGDASAMSVVDITSLPYKIAAVYRNNEIQPMAFPSVIHQFALKYNRAMVLVEANFGQQIADILWQDLEYENIVQTARNVKRGDQISAGFAASTRPGLVMNKLTKRLGCSNLKTLIEQDQLLITDGWIYDELCRFVVTGASYVASEGHDDLAMTLVMFGWLVDQGYVRDATNNDIRRKIAEVNARAIEDSMMALGGITRGLDDDFEAIDFTHPDDISSRHDKLAKGWSQPVPQPDPVELHNRFMADLLGF